MHKNNIAVPYTSGDEVVDFLSGSASVVSSVERPETELEVHSPHGVEDFHVEVSSGRPEKSRLPNPQILQNLITSLSLTYYVGCMVCVESRVSVCVVSKLIALTV